MVIPKDSERKKFANSLRKDLYESLQQESENTGIPLSKLLDKAVEKYLTPDRSIRISDDLFTTLVVFYATKGENINEVVSDIIAEHLRTRIENSRKVIDDFIRQGKRLTQRANKIKNNFTDSGLLDANEHSPHQGKKNK